MNYTNNYGLHLPELSEQFNLEDWNHNTDAIDEQMHTNEVNIGTNATNISNIITNLTTNKSSDSSSTYFKLMKLIYPVGSIYWSSNSTNPANLFGGTWTQIKDKFVWAKGDSDTVNATGGAKTVTLTSANLPTHTHSFSHTHGYTPSGKIGATSGGTTNKTAGVNDISENSTFQVLQSSDADAPTGNITVDSTSTWTRGYGDPKTTWNIKVLKFGIAHTHNAYFTGTLGTTTSQSTTTTGDGGFANTAVNKMPPYVVKYCWERTA